MQVNEAMINYQLLWFEAGDRLTTTRQLLTYLTAGVPDTGEETFWIACMNPKHRPICRTRLKTGVLVASRVLVRDVFLALLLAEASAFACLRTQPSGAVQPNLADDHDERVSSERGIEARALRLMSHAKRDEVSVKKGLMRLGNLRRQTPV